jgi:hypothetical protein
VDYEDAVLLDDVVLDYKKMVNELQREYHLPTKRFYVCQFLWHQWMNCGYETQGLRATTPVVATCVPPVVSRQSNIIM